MIVTLQKDNTIMIGTMKRDKIMGYHPPEFENYFDKLESSFQIV
jgi:hypothetical protein